jgi:hypothetical protein
LKIKGNGLVLRDTSTRFDGSFHRWKKKGTLALDPSGKRRVMTWRLPEWPGRVGERITYASYSVEGDTLRLGITLFSNDPKKLPAKFVTDSDDDVVVLTYRRERK